MSVLKNKRSQSQFEVFHHLCKLRRDITDLLLRDFGFSFERAESRLQKRFGGKQFDELSERDKEYYKRLKKRWSAFDEWFLVNERETIVECLRDITREVFIANSVYPTCYAELEQRRMHQNEAIGHCYRLTQELQYAIETLPVDVNTYLRFGDAIQTEINLIKGWRKSDNKKFKRVISENANVSAANFANVNNNGNCNNNNASNDNGVRPDFDSVV